MFIKPKKWLGQNFLIDQNVQNKIIAACSFDKTDTVLEIGSGRGELTHLIAPKVNKLFAVEIDRRLIPRLEEKTKLLPNVKIISGDFLKIDLEILLDGNKKRIKVFGNVPYYITTPIIEKLFGFRELFDIIYLTVQKEFAERIAASAGSKDFGSFSCFVQYYAEPRMLFEIKKNSFAPPPKVDSCFLELALRKDLPLDSKQEERLFRIIRAAFGKRRKILKNSLETIVPGDILDKFFGKYKLTPNIRPERLTLHDFINLSLLAPS